MSLSEALDKFEAAINELDLFISDYSADEPDAQEVAQNLARFERIRIESIKVVQQNFFNVALATLEEDEEIQVGEWVVKRGWTAKKSKWRHKDLAEHLFSRLKDLSMSDDGEVLLTPRQAVDGILGCAHIDNWRKRDLKRFDINPDTFVDWDEPVEVVTVGKAI